MYRYFLATVNLIGGLFKATLVLAIVATTSGCLSIPSDQKTILMEPVRKVAAQPSSRIHLHIPAGEVKVLPSKDGQLTGELKIYCDSDSGGCAKRAERVKFVTTVSEEETRIGIEPERALKLRNAKLQYVFYVPNAELLEVSMGPGTLVIDNVSACVQVDMDAGDLKVTALESTVKAVHLRANFGDASLKLPENRVEGNRKLLVGARVDWQEGNGSCTIKGHLQAGDARVKLQ